MKWLILTILIFTVASCQEDLSRERDVFMLTDNDSFDKVKSLFGDSIQEVAQEDGQTVFFAKSTDVLGISHSMHQLTDRCGGFFAFDTQTEAMGGIFRRSPPKPNFPQITYTITHTPLVQSLSTEIDASKILASITHLARHHNRYYRSTTGVTSQTWVRDEWQRLNQRGSQFQVELIQHKSWLQPSVVATWEGSSKPEEVVVIGGHGDSINLRLYPQEKARAPGADDNASGIATITEIIRVLMESDYQPERTIKFFSYAAEEVGLRGSKEIVTQLAKQKLNVVAAMQLDMTNHATQDQIFSFVRDHTNDKLTLFVQKLADLHLDIKWINDRCGYACSDHASWTSLGYPSVFPFESRFHNSNSAIHSAADTLQNSDRTAKHALQFARLGLAYIVEVAK